MIRFVLVAVVVMGCGPARLPGAPAVGDPCSSESPECLTERSLAVCDVGRWIERACEDRCSNEQSPKCVLAKPVIGEQCPASSVGKVACSSDPNTLAKCRADAGAQAWAPCRCDACDTSAGVVQCGNRLECD